MIKIIKELLKTLLWAFFLLITAGVLFAAWAYRKNDGEVRIVNEAQERVVYGRLEISSRQFEFGDIKPGESRLFHYKIGSDSHYIISVEFDSRKKLVRELGYVTHGFNIRDTLIIKGNDITLGTLGSRVVD